MAEFDYGDIEEIVLERQLVQMSDAGKMHYKATGSAQMTCCGKWCGLNSEEHDIVGPHAIRELEEAVCNNCQSSLEKHVEAGCVVKLAKPKEGEWRHTEDGENEYGQDDDNFDYLNEIIDPPSHPDMFPNDDNYHQRFPDAGGDFPNHLL